MIKVSGLHLDDTVGDIEHASRDAIRAEAVNKPAVATLPEQAAKPTSRTYEEEIVQFVEVPLVEKELVEATVTAASAFGVSGERM